jgi:DNA-binding winged helix-turn-helix (wHTH) protein/tetratricopeptide (TPR) repeat protein
MMDVEELQIYEFGPFNLETVERRLLRDGQVVPLTAKLFDILLLLVQKRGQLVKKEELMNSIWPDSFVEEHNLAVHISALRKALGQSRGGQVYIETIPKHGYRFVARVSSVPYENSRAADVSVRDEAGTRRAQAKLTNSLAVLPFTNTGDELDIEYLSDGITESIINSLALLPSLRIMAHSTVFRYKEREVDPVQAGREMGVGAVLVGRLLHVDGRLIVRIELVNVADGSRLWGEQYNRQFSDIFTVQEEIAREVSEKLRLRLTSEEKQRLLKRYTDSSDAYQLYLRGRYFWNQFTKEGLEKGVECFKQAVLIDPNYALAHAALADCYYRLSNTYLPPGEAWPKAREAAIRALEIDSELAEAHVSLGMVRMSYDFDMPAAEKEFKRGIELNPSSAQAHRRYGMYLILAAQFDSALSELELAQELDPLSLQGNVSLGTCLYFARRYEESIEQLQKILELDPNYYPAHFTIGCAYTQTGDFTEAMTEFQQVCRLEEEAYLALGFIGYVYGRQGELDEAEKILDRLKAEARLKYISPYCIAIVYVGLDDKDRAFEWLEKLKEERNDWLPWLKVAPEVQSLDRDPRFHDLLLGIKYT